MHRRFSAAFVIAACCFFPVILRAQPDSGGVPSRTRVGLAAVGAVTVHGGFASIQRGFHGALVGGTIDFGHVSSSKVRLLADVSYLLTFPHSERVISENRTYRDVFRDLSGDLSLAVHGNAPTSRLSPYVAAGLGVHVLSSSFGSLAIDTRYNTNNFGVLAAAGARLRVGTSGRRGVQVEVRQVQARSIRRTSVHIGLAALFNDLARR